MIRQCFWLFTFVYLHKIDKFKYKYIFCSFPGYKKKLKKKASSKEKFITSFHQRLAEAENAISDEAANNFWNTNFHGEKSVPWIE